MEGFVPGLILLASGVLIWIVVRVILRVWLGWGNLDAVTATLKEHEHAVLVVRFGGRAVFANQKARELFHLRPNEKLNLERLARQVRPAEQFLAMCNADGQGRFMLGGYLTESNSYSMVVEGQRLQVLVFQKKEVTSRLQSPQNGQNQTLQTITEISRSVVSSLDLEVTLQTIMDGVEKVVPSDFMQIALWDRETEELLAYRLLGFPGTGSQVELSGDRFRLGEGYTGIVAHQRAPLLVPDVQERPDISPAMDIQSSPLQSYVGVPMVIGRELIGTLELGALAADRFQKEDLEVVELLSEQAAIAIHNSRLYQEEKRRAAELASLSQMTLALSALSDPATLFTHMVTRIKSLFQVEVLGFLIYDPETRVLAGRLPFHGLPAQFVELYQTTIQPGSAAARILEEQDVIFSDNAAEDERWEQLGLGHLAKAASLRGAVLMPLSSGGRMLGYLQASNRKNDAGAALSHDELRLLTIIANQAALIIENSHLRAHSKRRNQRVETLRQISAIASSAAALDEVLARSLRELANLVQADVAFMLLNDQQAGRLVIHQESIFDQNGNLGALDFAVPMNDPQYLMTVTTRRHSLLVSWQIEKEISLPFYQSVVAELQVESLMIVPLVVRGDGIGELWLGSLQDGDFSASDLQVMTMATSQLASVIDHNSLALQNTALTAESMLLKEGRERRVEKWTTELRQEYRNQQAISEYIANVNHEMRTPMTALKGYIEMLLVGASGEINQEQRDILQIISRNFERLNLLVGDLLDVSRIESGRVMLSSEALDVGKIAEDVVAEIKRRAQKDNKMISIDLQVNGDLPVCCGDPLRVHQILYNLVSNAYFYTPQDGQVEIRMHAAGGDEVQVDVKDNGIGIDPTHHERIFERFYRGDDAMVAAHAGAGLGLAITRALVEMHKGRIWFHSEGQRGKGSVFSFVLPAYRQE